MTLDCHLCLLVPAEHDSFKKKKEVFLLLLLQCCLTSHKNQCCSVHSQQPSRGKFVFLNRRFEMNTKSNVSIRKNRFLFWPSCLFHHMQSRSNQSTNVKEATSFCENKFPVTPPAATKFKMCLLMFFLLDV